MDHRTKQRAREWMLEHLDEHTDRRSGVVNVPSLATAAAGVFAPGAVGAVATRHWVWQVATVVGEMRMVGAA